MAKRGPAAFTQSAVTRAVKGAIKGGMAVSIVTIDRTGNIVIRTGEAAPTDAQSGNEWDTPKAGGPPCRQ